MKRLLFLAILILASILRFYKLEHVPPSLNWDEAAIGYNAYSLIKTGGFDEYGKFLPLAFRSFDDYKPPLYIYLTTIPVSIFGLNDIAIRFTSAITGVLTVIFTYLLTLVLVRNHKIALLTMFFLSVSPWHLQFSRVAFEANMAVFFTVLGTWAFLKGVSREKGWFLILSAIFFGLSFYTYHSLRVFTPLLSVVLIFLYRKELLKSLKHTIFAILIALLFFIPFVSIATSISGQMRFKGTAIFYQPEPLETSIKRINEDKEMDQEFLGRIIHNRRLAYLRVIIQNYLTHFRPEFLLFEADTPTHHAPGVGLLYLWELPFILLGVYYLFKKNFGRPTTIITAWFLLGPLASSFTWETPSAIRSEVTLPTYQFFTAMGVFYTLEILKKKKIPKVFFLLPVLLFLLNFTYYLHQYHGHLNRDFSREWNYGRKEASEFVSKLENRYRKIIVSTNLDKAYMHFLYYLKYDPKKYLQEGGTVSGGFLEQRNKFGRYEFRQFDFNKERKEGNFLFVGEDDEFPADANVLKTIDYLDKERSIKIVES